MRSLLFGCLLLAGVEAFISPTGPRALGLLSPKVPGPSAHRSLSIVAAKTKSKKGTGKAPASKGFGKVAAPQQESVYDKALKAKKRAVVDDPKYPRAWLELGAVLVKIGDYAEAEKVFELGNKCAPGDDMLSGAYVSLAGHSAQYFGGEVKKEIDPISVECPFDVYELDTKPMDFRTTSWQDSGRIQVSKAPLIKQEECQWAIDEVERWAAKNGGWTSARHAAHPTTDLPVKEVPKLLEWFNEKLETTLFPMLARRYPDKIKGVEDIRVHDAFIVKYDAEGQPELNVHVDESAFSFTIALNNRDQYEGGGTSFVDGIRLQGSEDEFESSVLNADAGGVVCFPGKVRHGGSRISKGLRYIIPLFCYLHENASGNPKGYITNSLEKLVPES